MFVPNGTTFDPGGLTITAPANHPIHLIFDSGVFTYTGTTSPAITCNGVGGVIIEGAGRETNGNNTGTTISGNVIGITATNCDAIIVKQLNLTGPSSGSSAGVYIASNSAHLTDVQVGSFGGDGITIDGSAANANDAELDHVYCFSNGGNGLTSLSSNGQDAVLVDFVAQANTGDGIRLGNSLTVATGIDLEGNKSGIGLHLMSGAVNNYIAGFVDSVKPQNVHPTLLESGATENVIWNADGSVLVTFSAGANNNILLNPSSTVTDSGAGNRYFSSPSAWNTVTTNGLSVGPANHQFFNAKQVSAAITPTFVGPGACVEQTFPNAAFFSLATSDIPYVSSNVALLGKAFPVNYRISAAGTLAITYCNPSASSATPTASTVTVTTFH